MYTQMKNPFIHKVITCVNYTSIFSITDNGYYQNSLLLQNNNVLTCYQLKWLTKKPD
jgi:hypothetical protein